MSEPPDEKSAPAGDPAGDPADAAAPAAQAKAAAAVEPPAAEAAPAPAPANPGAPAPAPGPGPRTWWQKVVAFAAAHPTLVGVGLVCLFVMAVYVPLAGSYGLWDPWETHYGEVARRMVHEHDYLFTRWQNESFRSKPPLTFWIMGAGMKLFGIGSTWGGGDFAHSALTEWAIRLPFVMFGVFGIAMAYLAISRLVSRRAGILTVLVLTTTPFYFFLARQAITDMPACALLIGGLSCYLLGIYSKDAEEPLPVWARLGPLKITPLWLFFAVLGLFVVPQFVHYLQVAPQAGARIIMFKPGFTIRTNTFYVMLGLIFAFVGLCVWAALTCKTRRQVWMYYFYFLNGIGVLAKVYPPLESGLVILLYLIISGEWHILKKSAILWGVCCVLVVSLPWHVGMYQRDGQPWAQEYFIHHLLNRTTMGVHGDRGTFEYFLQQLGVGLFPWIALLPAALIRIVTVTKPRDTESRVRMFLAAWAISTFAFYSLMLTKFHHYILPCVPSLMMMVALYLDDLLAKRARASWLAGALGLTLLAFVCRDFIWNAQRFIHLFVYNYGRQWPSDYGIDFHKALLVFSILAAVGMATIFWVPLRRVGLALTFAVALAFTIYGIDHYMPVLSPHWSQKYLINTYFELRKDPSEHLLAWQMNWRGENFYSKSEIWDYTAQPDLDYQTVFMSLDNAQFLNYLKARPNKKYFLITEKGRVDGLKGVLRGLKDDKGNDLGARANDSFRIEDESSNKFTLVSFTI